MIMDKERKTVETTLKGVSLTQSETYLRNRVLCCINQSLQKQRKSSPEPSAGEGGE